MPARGSTDPCGVLSRRQDWGLLWLRLRQFAKTMRASFCPGRLAADSEQEGGGPAFSSVLKQPEDVAIGVGDGGHQAAATDVVPGLLHGGTGGGHLGQLRLEVGHVPVGHR
jgi:hypothetical protein